MVDARFWRNTVLNRHEVNHGHFDEEFLGIAILKLLSSVVPLASLQVETVDVAASLRLGLHILMGHRVHNDVREADLIDGDSMLSSKVLLSTCEESLWEEEARNPEDIWSSVIEPVRKEVNTVIAVHDPRSKRLQTQESLAFSIIHPHRWNLVVKD